MYNGPISQIPQCIKQISHNAPCWNINVQMCVHFCYEMMRCGIEDWCIVRFVQWFNWYWLACNSQKKLWGCVNFNTNLLKVSYMGDYINLRIMQFTYAIYICNNSWNKDKSLRCCVLIMEIPKAGWKTVLILKQPISNHQSLVAHNYIGSSLAQVIPGVVLSTWPLILDFVDVGLKQGKSEGFDSCDRPSNLKLDSNRQFFRPCDREIWWMTLQNNKATLRCYFKLCASFRSHWWIQTSNTVRNRPIWVKLDNF